MIEARFDVLLPALLHAAGHLIPALAAQVWRWQPVEGWPNDVGARFADTNLPD
jgi:hypothetical protein